MDLLLLLHDMAYQCSKLLLAPSVPLVLPNTPKLYISLACEWSLVDGQNGVWVRLRGPVMTPLPLNYDPPKVFQCEGRAETNIYGNLSGGRLLVDLLYISMAVF